MSDTLRLTTADGMDIDLEVAGVGSRSYAFVADWHIRVLFVLAWLLAVLLVFEEDSAGGLSEWFALEGPWVAYVIVAPPALVYLLYHPVLEILMRGRTPGKRLAGVRIVTLEGQTPGIGALLVRNVLRLIDGLPGFYLVGLVVALTTRRHVRIGDLAAGTMLVHEAKVSEESLQTAKDLALSQSLAAEDQALLLDLVERWRSLRREARVDLGRRFLERVGVAMPEDAEPALSSDSSRDPKPSAALDRALFERLATLAGKSPRTA